MAQALRQDPSASLKILRDEALDASLREKGYVIVPFLEAEGVAKLKATFHELVPQVPDHFYATSHSPDLAFRKRANDAIASAFADPVNTYFHHCRQLGGSFIAKPPGPRGYLRPHQDWNIVDESQFRSFNVWVPLVDVSPANGTIEVLDGSHLLTETLRGPNIPSAWRELEQAAWDWLKPLEMQAGEALIYDHRLLHGSPVNKSQGLRLAAVFGVIPEAADMLYYFGRQQETNQPVQVEAYKANVDFFMEQFPERGPGTLELLEKVPYAHPAVNFEQVVQVWPDLKPPASAKATTETQNQAQNSGQPGQTGHKSGQANPQSRQPHQKSGQASRKAGQAPNNSRQPHPNAGKNNPNTNTSQPGLWQRLRNLFRGQNS